MEKKCLWCGEPLGDCPAQTKVHKECKKEYTVEFRKKKYRLNPEAVLERQRENYKKFGKARNARKKESGYAKKYYENNLAKVLVRNCFHRAKEKNLDFDLTEQELHIPDLCPVFGEPLIPSSRYGPSIDRIDNTKGYTKNNVRVISKKANLMKNDATKEELVQFAKWVLETFDKNN